MIRIALALAVLAACYPDDYRCHSDADCDVEGGRCEQNGRCTAYDPNPDCTTNHSYTDHSGELATQCYTDAVIPQNLCAAGQAPALKPSDGCIFDLCEAHPACCNTGWSEPCAVEAQLRCGMRCDTSIALTALGGAGRETWSLHWDGATWTPTQLPFTLLASYLPPPPGGTEPRLAGLSAGNVLAIDGASYELDADRAYQAITGVDFDRAGRDTVALTYQQGTPTTHSLEVLDLASGSRRSIETAVSIRLSWGDDNHDGFPDAAAGTGAAFRFLDNEDTPGDRAHTRTMSNLKTSGVGADQTTGSPQLRSFEWLDLDGDKALDFVAFGNSMRIHLADPGGLSNAQNVNYDCDPPGPAGQCMMPQSASFTGAAMPAFIGKPAIAIATFEAPFGGRNVYLVTIRTRDPLTLDVARIDMCPACQPFIALAARALDGDQLVDLVGIDSKLHVWTALSSRGMAFVESTAIPSALNVNQLILSLTGAPN